MMVNPLLLTLPVDRPERFSGNRWDWRRFWRSFEKYDRDIQSMGVVGEAARVRALEALLDKAGQYKVITLQAEADMSGTTLTLAAVKPTWTRCWRRPGHRMPRSN